MKKKTTTIGQFTGVLGRIKSLIVQVAQAAAEDIAALNEAKADKGHTHTAANVGAVPTSRKVNGKALSADISLSASDVNALPITGGTVTGKTTYSGGLAVTSAGNNNAMQFFLGIKAFAEGGDVEWIDKSSVCADIGAQKKSLTGSVIIPTTGWGSDSTAIYPKYYDITVSGVTAGDRANVDIATASLSAAVACGLCSTTETLDGKIRIRAASVPTAALAANYWIEKGD